jgi:YD repeat-containing protein
MSVTDSGRRRSDYEQYSYDAVGNWTSLRKRDGRTIGFSYDGLNRLRVKTVPSSVSGAPGYSVHYGYDVQGLMRYALRLRHGAGHHERVRWVRAAATLEHQPPGSIVPHLGKRPLDHPGVLLL